MDTKIYSVFPACGKTYLFENQDDYGLKILDSDSSQFSWKVEEVEDPDYVLIGEGEIKPLIHKNKVRNPDFPNNYIEHIKNNIGKYDYIFVSSHREVRQALDNANIDYTIVYPEEDCLAEWVGRCYLRELNGNNGFPIEVLVNNWYDWINGCMVCGMSHKEIVLRNGEYLSKVFV